MPARSKPLPCEAGIQVKREQDTLTESLETANYFGDLIKKETGVSAQEYILTKIMDRAKELLTDPAKSVGDVAYALGYQYPQYFSKAFKRVVGCSPNEYRTLS